MANTSLPNLTERTATANSDLIHVNSGGTDYKETKGNFLSDVNSSISALNSSLANLTSTGDTYVGTGATTITLKRFPALVVFRGSGNTSHGIILCSSPSVSPFLIYEKNEGSATNLSLSGNTLSVTFSSTRGYSVFY